MLLKYHQPTIDLIAGSPFLQGGNSREISSDNMILLDEKEKQYNIQFPASIREWFSLNVPTDISHYEHGTPQIGDLKPLSEMKEVDHPQTSKSLWFFLLTEYIDQGGDYLFFHADGSEDPPIYAKHADDFIKINEKFSSFLYNHFWDYHKQSLCPYSLRLINHPAIEMWQLPTRYHVSLQTLRGHYNELSDNLQSRFYDDHVCIWAYNMSTRDDEVVFNNEAMSHGHIVADSIEKFEEVINYLWENDKPVRNFFTSGNEERNLFQAFQQKDKK